MVTESKDYFQMFPIYNGHQQQQQQQKQQHIKCFLKHWTATAGVNSSKFNAEQGEKSFYFSTNLSFFVFAEFCLFNLF